MCMSIYICTIFLKKIVSKKKLNGAERPREGGISRADATSTYHNRIKIFWTK
jgi:hypothetical protein